MPNISVFFNYIKLGGVWLKIAWVLMLLMSVFFQVYGNYWISNYSVNNRGLSFNDYFLIYLAFVLAYFFIKIMQIIMMTYFFSIISFKLYEDLIVKLFRKRLYFFDQTPNG